jgi:hypothetical protein
MRYSFEKFFHFVYPSGKPMPSHLLRCQGLAIDDYSFALGTPWSWDTLDFRSITVKEAPGLLRGKGQQKTMLGRQPPWGDRPNAVRQQPCAR